MTTLTLLLLIVAGAGVSLVLTGLPWFRRVALADRLRPYTRHGGAVASPGHRGLSLNHVLVPVLADAGTRLGRLLGVTTDLATRLARADSPLQPDEFRLRQFAWTLSGLLAGAMLAIWISPPAALAALLVVGLPVLAALGCEQQLSNAAAGRQRRLTAELPVVVEQLGMLLSAGFSLTAALSRLADRGTGVIAHDLAEVVLRIRQGVSIAAALTEWAELTDLDSVRRLVTVLGLHSEAGDLGALISGEARAVRDEAHRDLLETIERRSQLVWIPVTVATLVPGLIFLAVPFYSAMSQVTGGS
ncbi:hypothetical protein BH10ACT3_BH10ACT3_07630 [soil metagenome]